MTNIVKINGKHCDLSEAFPIKLGVLRKLLKKGIDASKSELSSLESMEFMGTIIESVNSEITENDIDQLTPDEFANISKLINTLSSNKSEPLNPLDGG